MSFNMPSYQVYIDYFNKNYITILMLLYFFIKIFYQILFPKSMKEYPGSKVIEVTSDEMFNEVTSNAIKSNPKQVIIIDFYATWCGPCVNASPIYSQLSIGYHI